MCLGIAMLAQSHSSPGPALGLWLTKCFKEKQKEDTIAIAILWPTAVEENLRLEIIVFVSGDFYVKDSVDHKE